MIFDMIINGFLDIVNDLCDLLPTIPASGLWSGNTIINVTDTIFTNLGLLHMIAPISLIVFILSTMLTCVAIKFGYVLIMWVIHKIPFVGIK